MAANNASRNFAQTNPVFTGTLTGVTNGDITATYSSTATIISPVGTSSYYTRRLWIRAICLTNYNVTLTNVH